jgi:hypothetical protein
LEEMQNASTDMKSSIEATNRLGDAAARSNVEAHRLADEARRSADIAKETAERQLRAYVDIVDNNILKCPVCDTIDIDKPIDIKRDLSIYDNIIIVTIQNSGETPAYNIHIDDSYWWGNWGQQIPKGFTYPIIPVNRGPRQEGSTGTLGRGERAPGGLPIDVSIIPMIAKARKHIVSLFHYGNIYYKDVFGIDRNTPFCFEYVPDYPENPFANCPEHNTPEQGK